MIPIPPKPRYAPGARVRVTQEVRVGHRRWTTSIVGAVEDEGVRPVGGMEMGGKASYCLQPTLRLRRDDGEITVLSLDASSVVEDLSGKPAAPGGA
jgi:hypothetical protein